MTTTKEHRLIRTVRDGRTTISCPCGWSATGRTAGDIDWMERAMAAHLGIDPPTRIPLPARERPLRLVGRVPGMCHVACYDEHGHTDGCLYDGPEN